MKNQKGQVVVEYVLILVVSVSLAFLLTKGLASRNPDDPGVIVKKWYEILKVIGEDSP